MFWRQENEREVIQKTLPIREKMCEKCDQQKYEEIKEKVANEDGIVFEKPSKKHRQH